MADPTKDEIAFLAMLSSGREFTAAARELGPEALRAPFNCILNGWVDRGSITQKGRDVVEKALKPTPWSITVLPRSKT